MKVAILQEPLVEIEIGDDEELDAVLERVAALPEVIAIAEKVGKESYYEKFSRENTVYDNSQLQPIAKAFLSGNYEELNELEDEWGNDVGVSYNETVADDLKGAFDDIADALVELGQFSGEEDTVKDTLEENLRQECMDAMEEADKTTFADRFGSHDKIELSFALDMNVLGFDDLQVQHIREHQFDAWTADPNANLMRMFKMFNIDPVKFIEAMTEKYGQDPRVPFVEEKYKDQHYRVDEAEKVAAKWKRFDDIARFGASGVGSTDHLDTYEQREIREIISVARTFNDIDRPAAFDMDTLFLIMSEASYGGTPCYTARYPIADIIKGKLDHPFLATGGFVGIHNFSNGSGYVEIAKAEVLVNPAVGGFTANSIDGTYSIVGSYYDNTTREALNANWVHVETDSWRTEETKDRTYAKIDRLDGGNSYWVETFVDGVSGGLYADMERFDSLQEAMDAGLRAISLTPEELEAEQSSGLKI
jgi:hypothetical protein